VHTVIERPCGIAAHPHDRFILRFLDYVETFGRHPDWLDVGCGWHFDWPSEIRRETELVSKVNVVGIDPDRTAIRRHRSIGKRVVGGIERLPFREASFDFVTANVVIEHVRYPALALSEVHRVLRAGGIFLFRTPSAKNHIVALARRIPQGPKVWLAGVIERRKPEDVYPAFYRLNTCEAITEVCEIVGFRELRITVTRARGLLTRFPAMAALERRMTAGLGFREGNIIAEAQK
jgi:SAM-dependent methyltransferase